MGQEPDAHGSVGGRVGGAESEERKSQEIRILWTHHLLTIEAFSGSPILFIAEETGVLPSSFP